MTKQTDRQRKGKAIASTSTGSRAQNKEPEITTFPWPRPAHTPFVDEPNGKAWHCALVPNSTMREMQRTASYQSYRHGDPWTHHHCQFYNGWLRIELLPTRVVHSALLAQMGIVNDVRTMLEKIGLARICQARHHLHPELVRQFFASAELWFDTPAFPVASEGHLSFFSSGKLYDISIRNLCDIYGFDRTAESCRFPSDFPQAAELWYHIGSGAYTSREAKQSRIRNPAIRVVTKIISTILFGKEESGAVRYDELMLLHYALPSFVSSIYDSPPPSTLGTNLGAIFAANLVAKKARGLRTATPKVERIGNLLTPLFMTLDIDLSPTVTPRVLGYAYFDEQYFKNAGILKPGLVYQFQDRSGAYQYCKLPMPQFTALTSRATLEFEIPAEHLQQLASAPRRCPSSYRASSSSQPRMEDNSTPDAFPRHSQSAEALLPPYQGQFAPPPLAPDATDADFRAWSLETADRQHSMLARIWDFFARVRCPPPPSCFSAPQTTDDPAVAGQEAPAAADDDDLSDPDIRLPRRRRRQGQSRSVSPGDP